MTPQEEAYAAAQAVKDDETAYWKELEKYEIRNPRAELNFESIRSIFFPKWDRKHEWILRDAHPGECFGLGYCVSTGKIIVVTDDTEGTLIHEIAHAVTHQGHGKKWQNRMEKAARKAEKAESSGFLAACIRKDYTTY